MAVERERERGGEREREGQPCSSIVRNVVSTYQSARHHIPEDVDRDIKLSVQSASVKTDFVCNGPCLIARPLPRALPQ